MTNGTLPQTQIGWIGAGRMGVVMARRLAEAGAQLTVFNRSIEKAKPLAQNGAKIASSLVDLRNCEIIFLIVSTDDAARDVLLGEEGLLAARSSAVRAVVDCSSISVDASAALRAELDRAGVAFLAAPVSGNPHVLAAGRGSFVTSGPQALFDEAEPFLRAIGRAAIYAGAGEQARVAKICHNVWLGTLTQGLAEVLVLAQKAGMTRTAFLTFLNNSALGSDFTKAKAPHWQSLDFTPTFTPPLMRKDLDLGLLLADQLNAPMPLSELTREMVLAQINQGMADLDFSTLLLLQARAAGLEMTAEAED